MFMCMFASMRENLTMESVSGCQNSLWNRCSSFFLTQIMEDLHTFIWDLCIVKMVFLAHFQSTKLVNCYPTFTYDAHLGNFPLWARVQSLSVRCSRWQQKFRPESAHNSALLWVAPAGSLERVFPAVLRGMWKLALCPCKQHSSSHMAKKFWEHSWVWLAKATVQSVLCLHASLSPKVSVLLSFQGVQLPL